MCTDFVIQVKYTIFWLNRGLRLYLDWYVRDVQRKVPQGTFYILILFSQKHHILEPSLVKKKHQKYVKPMFAKN